MPGYRESFAYGNKVGALVAWGVLLALWGWLALMSAVHGEWDGVTASLVVSLISSLIFGLLLIARSDVVVSDQGIARSLWGWTWRTMDWSNVDRIKEFPVSKGNGRSVLALNVFPKVKPPRRFTPSGKVFFTLDVKNTLELVVHLNRYIAAHGIPLVVSDTLLGEPKPATELL